MENTDYIPIKFYGNKFFFAILLFCNLDKKYYFAFSKISSITYKDKTKKEWIRNNAGIPLYCFSKDSIGLEISGEEFNGINLINHIMHIDYSDFDILCKLLECIYDE